MTYFDQTKLRQQIVFATGYVRDVLTQHGYDGRFTLNMKIEGSADKTDAKLSFDFDLSRNYGSHVISPVLCEAVNELMRRMGFDKINQAELLTYDPVEQAKIEALQAPVPAPRA